MGYTHFWRVPKNLDPKTFKVWVSEVKTILVACEKRNVHVEDLTLTDDEVFFNGTCETFFIRKEANRFSFCKTNRGLYDLAVTTCLLRFRKHFPGAEVSSDGDINMTQGEKSDWYPAYCLESELFDVPLEES